MEVVGFLFGVVFKGRGPIYAAGRVTQNSCIKNNSSS